MACLAITNNRRCRNWATIKEGVRELTCPCHTSYFNNKDAVKIHLYKYAQRTHMFSWANGWIQDGLECGALEFDKEDFENIIFNRDFPFRWISFILIYSLYYTILPEWNIELWQNTIRQLWRICQSVGPITATWNDMQRLLCVKGDIGRFYKGIGYSQVYQLEEEWIQFFELCASADPEWFLEFWMTEPPSNVPPIFKSDLYIAWITDKKEEFMARPLPVKEELIATTWSPSRILPWILDSDEKQEVGKRWVL